jgi:hypothetical protein
LSQIFLVNGLLTTSGEIAASNLAERVHNSECDCRAAKAPVEGDFKGRHFEAWLIVQAVAWYLRYPLSY